MMNRNIVLWFNRIIASTVSVMIIFTAGCASMISTKEELKNLADNEGVVVGSIFLTAQKLNKNEPKWDFLKGGVTEERAYTVYFTKKKPNSKWAEPYMMTVKPGQEEIFIKKLPAGDYMIDYLEPAKTLMIFSAYPVFINLKYKFKVKPRQTSYIGKFVVNLPDRLISGRFARTGVLDAQVRTLEKLRPEHTDILRNTTKDLASLEMKNNSAR